MFMTNWAQVFTDLSYFMHNNMLGYTKWHYWSLRKKEVILRNFPWIGFRDLRFRMWGLEIKHLKAHICDKGVFYFIIISQLWRPIEFKFSQVCYFVHMLRCETTGLWQLPIVSSVFKQGFSRLQTWSLIYGQTHLLKTYWISICGCKKIFKTFKLESF